MPRGAGTPSARVRRNQFLTERFERALRSAGTPMVVRVCTPTCAQDVRCGRKRSRLIHQANLVARTHRRVPRTTDNRHTLGVTPNVHDRQFEVERPNEVWVSDSTYLPTREGWLYLAVVLDLYARRVVG